MLNTDGQRAGWAPRFGWKKRVACVLIGSLVMSACATTEDQYPYGSEPSISIPYNPYDFDPDKLFDEASAHCGAYGLSAVYVDETIDPQSVRWRYRHFSCV